ncbi:MAG: amidohydrolase family protein [Lachnospiraceae bacterium]|nr:amidohydrolase family protein [Lachnospiraceae bacterium]
MKKFITRNDIMAVGRQGGTEYVLGEDDRLTDLARETAKQKGIRLVRKKEVQEAALPVSKPKAPASSPVGSVAILPKASCDLIIKNGIVVLPEAGCLKTNICVKEGKIVSLTSQTPSARQEIDARGLYVLPGIIDPHTHLGLFAPLDTELVSETRSAILGGVTTIGTFFNQSGSYLPLIEMLREKVPSLSRVDMFPHFTLREEAQLAELPQYSACGMNSFKVYMCGIPGLFPHQEDGFIVRTMECLKALEADPVLCVHAENASIVEYAEKDMAQHPVETLAEFGQSHPEISEGEAVIRTAYLSRKLGLRTYIVHSSTGESMKALNRMKHDKLYVETTSPYLSLDTSSGVGAYGKMLPPFRSPESRQALWEGIRAGIIDTIGTDNTTISSVEKKVHEGMGTAIAGYPALGTHLASVLNEGFFRQEIPLEKLIPLMTENPARIFGIYPQKGTLLPGSDADIVLVDMNRSRMAEPASLQSRSDFSVFQGKRLRGWPCGTIKGGRIAAWDGRLTDDGAGGSVLAHCMK